MPKKAHFPNHRWQSLGASVPEVGKEYYSKLVFRGALLPEKWAICPWLEEKEEKERGELGQSGAFLKSALSKCRYLKRVLKAGCMGHRE